MADREKIIEDLRQEIAELEACSPRDEREIERKKNLLMAFEENLFEKWKTVPAFNKEDYLRPEYREGGYFTSQDYYDKCDEFHRILEEHEIDYMHIPRGEYIYLKKEFFQNTYGITWLAEEEQYLPGTKIDVHAERL